MGFNPDKSSNCHHIYFQDQGIIEVEWSIIFPQHKVFVSPCLVRTLLEGEQTSVLPMPVFIQLEKIPEDSMRIN